MILGTGDPDYHHVLTSLHRQYPHQLSVTLDFSNELAHRIEAGADMFLMPSEYEPCGLNQLYSMAYGTIPVVRRTGGLADTVVNATVESIENRTANGFSFDEFSQTALEHALARAVRMYREDRETWTELMSTGMASTGPGRQVLKSIANSTHLPSIPNSVFSLSLVHINGDPAERHSAVISLPLCQNTWQRRWPQPLAFPNVLQRPEPTNSSNCICRSSRIAIRLKGR